MDRRRGQLGTAHLEVADLLGADPPPLQDPDAAAHPLEHVEQAGAARIEVDVVDRDPRLGNSVAATMNGAAEEKSPGTSTAASRRRSGGSTLTELGRTVTRAPASCSINSVWSRVGRARRTVVLPVGAEAGEQDRGLDLRARHRQLVVDRLERRAGRSVSGRWPSVVSIWAPMRRERLGDALHRPGRERLVTGQREGAVLEREQADDQPRQRAGVAAVDRRGLQAAQADAVHDELVAVVVDLGAERAHGARASTEVSPERPKPRTTRLAVRDRAEQQRPVRDRLVAGHREVPFERGRRAQPSSMTAEMTTP